MTQDLCTCTVEVSPDEVDAGADITLTVQFTHLLEDGLREPRVSIRDHDDAELAQTELTKSDGETYESNDIVLAAPRSIGEHVYRAVVIATGKDGASHEQASTEIRFVVMPHAAQLNVWGLPSAIVAGGRFTFTVGVKCSSACGLAGRELSIVGRDGSQLQRISLGDAIWPGTDALYFAEVEAEAPQTAGEHHWQVKTAAWSSELPHAADSFPLVLRVVSAPDCEVTVEAIDRDKQTPIKGARVVMHPYRAMTDEHGVAKVKVTKGQYDILVSGSKYVPVSTTVDVTADMITRAELDVEPPWESPDEA